MDNKLAINKTMTVKEICEAVNAPRQTVLDCINRIFPEKMKKGITTFLTENEVGEISKELKKAHNITGTREVAITDIEKAETIKKAFQYITEEVEKLNKQLNDQKPAVEFYDAVTDSKDAIEMSQVAKVLDMKMGRNKLFSILRQKKVLRYNNEPYQAYIDAGYFRIIENKWTTQDGEIKISIKTLVYQKGIEYIRKIIGA